MYICQVCLKSYQWPQDLTRHIRVKHNSEEQQFEKQQHYLKQQKQEQEQQQKQEQQEPQKQEQEQQKQKQEQQKQEQQEQKQQMPEQKQQMPETFDHLGVNPQPLTFKHPFTMTIAGPTSCGKTTWLKNGLSPRIFWCYREWQPLYAEMAQQMSNITFIQGIQVPDMDPIHPHLVVLDDLMIDATKNKDISNMFTVGSHHRNMSIICLLQNLFYQGKENRTMSLNSHYLVLFKNPRDQLQVSHLARQMYPHNSGYFMEKFQKATSKPYGCLVVDLKQDTTDADRLKSGQLQGRGPPGIPAYPNRKVVEGIGGEGQPADKLHQAVVVHNDPSETIKEEEKEGEDQLQAVNEPVNTMNACEHCGVPFQTPFFLKMHQQKGCSMDEEECEEDMANPWRGLLQQAFDKHDKLYQEKMADLMEGGTTEKRASQLAARDLLPKYRKSLVQMYKTFLEEMHRLSGSSHHKEVTQMLDWYMTWKGYSFEKSLDITLKKKRRLFEELLDDQEDEDTEEEAGSEKEEEEQETDSEDDIPLSELAKE
jgi:flagellar motor protein MotB